MTNEEKAQQLAQKYKTPCRGVGDCEFEAYQAALEAMRWKDQQYLNREIELLEGLKNEIATTTERVKVLRRIRLLKNKLQ